MRPYMTLLCVFLALIGIFILHAHLASAWLPLNYTETKKPAYEDPYTRAGNYTINITGKPIPKINVVKTKQLSLDVLVPNPDPVRLDPRTCPGQLAYCYQLIEHPISINFTYGKNFTNVANYTFPSRRVRMFSCVGDDKKCVAQARECFCPTGLPPPSPVLAGTDRCSDDTHLCETTPSFFQVCKGNITKCRENSLGCSCSQYDACSASKLNTCLNDREEMVLCRDTLPTCIAKYGTCSCGPEMMSLYAPSCTTPRHQCTWLGMNLTCQGSLQSCALQYDRCQC